ncbi:MAG: GtrA family protein [Verrucomicrobia bacterium]|nr:GtrA family protein [Verrucomicrobiota bacterium]
MKINHRARKLFQFLAAGLPAFLLAVPGNYALVEWAGVSKSLAYAIMLVCQVTMNYFMCRWFVFEKKNARAWYIELPAFASGILVIRLLDWTVYIALVHYVGIYYIVAQLFNVFVFAVLKFIFSEKILT